MLHDPKTLLAVAFVVFVVLVFKPVRRMLLKALDERIITIQGRFDEARQLREDAQSTLASYKRKQRLIQEEADKILTQAREEGANLKSYALNTIQADMAHKRAAMLEKISLAEKAAQAQVQQRIINTTMAVSKAMLQQCLTSTDFEKNFDNYLNLLSLKLRQ